MIRLLVLITIILFLPYCTEKKMEAEEYQAFFENPANGFFIDDWLNGYKINSILKPKSLIALYDIGPDYYQLKQNELDSFIAQYENDFEVLITLNTKSLEDTINLREPDKVLLLQSDLETYSRFELGRERFNINSCLVLPSKENIQILFGLKDFNNNLPNSEISILLSSKILNIPNFRINFKLPYKLPNLKAAL